MTILAMPVRTRTSERAARADLRAQIARLDRELTHAPHGGHGGPRLLGLADLEAERDALLRDLAAQQQARREEADAQEQARLLLERMLADPPAHRGVRIRAADLGQGGCGVYAVKPRLGLVGMLAGWWQVKLSSGCPLATARTTSARPAVRSAAPPRSRRAAPGRGARAGRA